MQILVCTGSLFEFVLIRSNLCFIDEQPFLPVNPFAEPATTMSTASTNHHRHDDDMIDIDFRNTTQERTSKCERWKRKISFDISLI